MGFEYKLRIELTDKQTNEIQDLFVKSNEFDKKYELNNKVFWDFRKAENKGEIPNISVIFEEDGIYICQYYTSYLWSGLDDLKKYIECIKIECEIIDYQD